MQADLVVVPEVLLARLAALGVELASVLRRAGIPGSRFQAKMRISTREFFAFWNALEEVGGARDLGLRLGTEARPHQYDVVSVAALHSPNLGEALKKLARYKRVVCPEQVFVEVTGTEARFRFHWVHAEGRLPRFLIDATFASALALAHRGLGQPLVPRRIELARRRGDEALLAKYFGCKVRFDAPVDLLVLDARSLELPFQTHNAELLEALLPGLDAALDERTRRRLLTDDVRSVLRRRMCGERPSVEKVAEELSLSPRTLQRKLEGLGTSYQRLLDEVRHQSSLHLLENTDLDVGEVAFLLGFEELNSFGRAFHGWEGTTPLRWRSEARSQGESSSGDRAH